MTSESENKVAERVRDVLAKAEPDLASYLLNGGTPSADDAIGDALAMVTMLGSALSGDNEYFGGEPATHVQCEWVSAIERKLELARALNDCATISDRSGSSETD